MKLAGAFRLGLIVACVAWAAPGPAGAQQAPAAPRAAGEAEYRIGPEDVLQVQVWGRADLSGQAVVDPAGQLQLPLVGRVAASGRTADELSRYLSERYRILDPRILDVSVAVSEYTSHKVTVLGEVRAPGPYALPRVPDLVAAILAAGGVTPQADLARVQVVRNEEQPGESRTLVVDLSRGLEKTPAGELPEIRPKDTVIVPSLGGEFASGDRFQVLGAVREPGSYRLPVAATVVEAISASGGATPDANLHKVSLTRPTQTGVLSYELDLQGYLYEASPNVDLQIRPGDTVTVPNKRSTLGTLFDALVRVAPVISVAVGLGYAFR